jgi:hypothetical protein
MAMAFSDKIVAPFIMKCGTRTRTKIIDIRRVAASVGTVACHALIGLHSFTGCDTVSSGGSRNF